MVLRPSSFLVNEAAGQISSVAFFRVPVVRALSLTTDLWDAVNHEPGVPILSTGWGRRAAQLDATPPESCLFFGVVLQYGCKHSIRVGRVFLLAYLQN